MNRNDKSLVEVVIPLGITGANNNMPRKDFLEFGLTLLKEQSIPVKITCAVDENLQPDRMVLIEKYADKIKIFPKHSYFRPGGIWKKIWECWKESTCKYVAWNGYDDYSPRTRFELQVETLEKNPASNSCFGSNFINDNGTIRQINDGKVDFIKILNQGHHPLYMGNFLINIKSLLNTDIEKYKEIWQYYFEGFFFYYIMRMGMPVVNSNAGFYYRAHNGTISATCKEKEEWVKKCIKEVNLTFENSLNAWKTIDFEKKCKDLGKEYLLKMN